MILSSYESIIDACWRKAIELIADGDFIIPRLVQQPVGVVQKAAALEFQKSGMGVMAWLGVDLCQRIRENKAGLLNYLKRKDDGRRWDVPCEICGKVHRLGLQDGWRQPTPIDAWFACHVAPTAQGRLVSFDVWEGLQEGVIA